LSIVVKIRRRSASETSYPGDMKRLLCVCVIAMVFVACHSSDVSPSTAPTIASLQPIAGPVGTRVAITGTGFQDNANTINFGASAYPNVTGNNGTSIVFLIPTATNPPCRNATPPCAIASALITPGSYDVSVTHAGGTSNAISFTVTSQLATAFQTPARPLRVVPPR
jgi:IPT/TIG domain-containing protein